MKKHVNPNSSCTPVPDSKPQKIKVFNLGRQSLGGSIKHAMKLLNCTTERNIVMHLEQIHIYHGCGYEIDGDFYRIFK